MSGAMAALAAVLVLLAMSCGDGASKATTRSQPLDEPTRALLNHDDLPPGWSRHDPLRASGTHPSTSLRVSLDAPRAGPNPYVAQTVEVYEPGAGRAAMATLRKLFAPGVTHGLAFPAEDGSTRTRRAFFWKLPPPKLGEESFAVWFDASDGSKGAFVAIRRGDAISMIRHFSSGTAGDAVDGELTKQLARRADERLAQALGVR